MYVGNKKGATGPANRPDRPQDHHTMGGSLGWVGLVSVYVAGVNAGKLYPRVGADVRIEACRVPHRPASRIILPIMWEHEPSENGGIL